MKTQKNTNSVKKLSMKGKEKETEEARVFFAMCEQIPQTEGARTRQRRARQDQTRRKEKKGNVLPNDSLHDCVGTSGGGRKVRGKSVSR